jgi:hypothetical protein
MARGLVGEVLVGLVAEVIEAACAAKGVDTRSRASSYTARWDCSASRLTIARVRLVIAAAKRIDARAW